MCSHPIPGHAHNCGGNHETPNVYHAVADPGNCQNADDSRMREAGSAAENVRVLQRTGGFVLVHSELNSCGTCDNAGNSGLSEADHHTDTAGDRGCRSDNSGTASDIVVGFNDVSDDDMKKTG